MVLLLKFVCVKIIAIICEFRLHLFLAGCEACNVGIMRKCGILVVQLVDYTFTLLAMDQFPIS